MPNSTPTTLADWLALLEQRHPRSIDLGLERCGAVWQRMGAPRPGKQVVTVAGTNGKGSTVAGVAALLRSLGRSTAVYTSPHLLRFNERLLINDRPVSDAALLEAFAAVEAARGQVSLTYFEFTTLACLRIMAAAGVDVAVLEVGLGGRLDTVNLVDADVAVITPIDLDHQALLGPDRERIGAEKAGILRPGKPLVCSEASPPDSVLAAARRLQCPVWLAERDYQVEARVDGLEFRVGALSLRLPAPPLAGAHQYANLAAALLAVGLLESGAGGAPWQGLDGQGSRLAEGVRSIRLAGRLQRAPGNPRVLLDVGHNPHAATAVARFLASAPPAACHCVLGMLADKDAEGVAGALAAQVDAWYCASLAGGGTRGQTDVALAKRIQVALPQAVVFAAGSVGQALQQALAAASDQGQVVVLGSFETVAAAQRELAATGAPADDQRGY